MKKIFVLLALLCVADWPAARALRLTLEECLSIACSSNPGLRIAELSVEKSRHLVGTAFDAPNTNIELSQDATDGGGMENGITFSQEFDFPTLYAARRGVLKAENAVAADAYNLHKNDVSSQIVSLYYSILALKAKLEILGELKAEYDRFAEAALTRYEAGETSRLEYLNADRLRATAFMRLRDAEAERKALSMRLAALLASDEEIEPADTTLCAIESEGLMEEFSPEFSYGGRLLASELNLARKTLNVARQEFLPGLFVAATSQLLIKSFNPYHVDRPRFRQGNFMGFQVGVTIPLFFGAKMSRLHAVRSEVEIARLKLEEASIGMVTELAEAREEYKVSLSGLRYYEEGGLARADEIMHLADVSYQLGEIDYLEFMQNIESAYSVRLEYIDSVDRYNRAVIRIKTIKGL